MNTQPDSLSPAIEALLDRYTGMVRRVGLRHGLSDADVDEVFQEVRIRLWRARGDNSEQISAMRSSYLYRTAVSAALDVIRRHRRPRETMLEFDDTDPVMASPSGPERTLAASELATQVDEAIGEIVASRRPVVRMYLTGYTREEIADLLGWTEAKTRNLLYRGLADLRELLQARGIGPEAI
ncbi:MAG TPA: sigma-70 family RNA polymerase sigma factor [Gemmatimonadaceae bacterium]